MGIFNTRVDGMTTVQRNLNREIRKIIGNTTIGMIKALAFIRYETEHTPPKTPMDYGNLRASWFVVTATGTPVGRGVSKFVNNPTHGIQAAKFAEDHTRAISDAQTEVKKHKTMNGFAVMGGYSANYAAAVHEKLNVGTGRKSKRASGKYISGWSRRQSGPKWLQTHLVMNQKKILDIIKTNARIP